MATASPSFGFFASSEELGPDEIIRAARSAEAAGFDRLWVSDHYHPWMSEQGSSPFVWSVLGALASTTRLKLTTAVTCPTFRIHPAILAQATATTAVLAPGRFTFGVGAGEALNEHILGDAWPPVSVRHSRLAEALDIIRRLWTGEVVTHEGTYFTVHDAKLFTRPQTPPDILVSGFGPEATKLAAQIGQGWISASPDAEGMKVYREAGGTGRTQAGAKICWAETEKEAKETAHRLWGHQAGGGQLSQDAPLWMQYEAIAQLTSPDDIAGTVPCGPDAARAAEAIAVLELPWVPPGPEGQSLTVRGAAGGLSGRVARRSAGIWSSRTGHRCRAGAPAGAGPASSSSGRNRDFVLHCHQPWPSGASDDSSPALRASFPSTGSALSRQAPATRTRRSKRDLQETRHHRGAAAYPATSAPPSRRRP